MRAAEVRLLVVDVGTPELAGFTLGIVRRQCTPLYRLSTRAATPRPK